MMLDNYVAIMASHCRHDVDTPSGSVVASAIISFARAQERQRAADGDERGGGEECRAAAPSRHSLSTRIIVADRSGEAHCHCHERGAKHQSRRRNNGRDYACPSENLRLL